MRASVIIPAFNADKTIAAAVYSALAQTESDIEILVINDRSTDTTEEIVDSIAREDKRVKLLQNRGPRGPSAARNVGIEASQGDWIILLDADDSIKSTRIQEMTREAEARSLDALADNLELVVASTGETRGLAFGDDVFQNLEPIDLEWLLAHDIPGGTHRTIGYCKPIIRSKSLRSALLTYDENIRMGEDFLLYGRMVIAKLRFGFRREAGYRYTLHSSSLSSSQRDSEGNIVVNRILRAAWVASNPWDQRESTARLFSRREAAFRYEDFIDAFKRRRFRLALRSMLRLSPSFALSKFGFAAKRRILRPGRRLRVRPGRQIRDVAG